MISSESRAWEMKDGTGTTVTRGLKPSHHVTTRPAHDRIRLEMGVSIKISGLSRRCRTFEPRRLRSYPGGSPGLGRAGRRPASGSDGMEELGLGWAVDSY